MRRWRTLARRAGLLSLAAGGLGAVFVLYAGPSPETGTARAASAASVAAAASTGASPATAAKTAGAGAPLPDAALVDQDGREVRFAALVEGRVAVVNAFFTSCEDICPSMEATLVGVADRLGPRLGDDVVMISLSLDPAADAPERLRAFAAKHGGHPGWHLLTGDRAALTRLVGMLGLRDGADESHSPILLLGTSGRTPWVRVSGFSAAPAIVERALSLADEA